MSERNNMIIAGADCRDCKYFDDNVCNNMIICEARNKKYFYGQYITCNDKEKDKGI